MFPWSPKLQHQLTQQRSELEALLTEIGELLEEIADAEADEPWDEPVMPVTHVPDRLEELARRLQQVFRLEEDSRYLTQLSRQSRGLREGFERFNSEHGELLELLEELCELAGTPIRPATSWEDIELHYRCFERRLSQHRQSEDALFEAADSATA